MGAVERAWIAAVLLATALTAQPGCGDGDAVDGGGAGAGGPGVGGHAAGGHAAGGATPGGCLIASAYEEFLELADEELCVVAVYDAEGLDLPVFSQPTWGLHGGPLTFNGGDGSSPTLRRWLENGDGVFTASAEEVLVDDMPSDAYWSSAVAEVLTPSADGCPASSLVALSWSFQGSGGSVVTIRGGASTSQSIGSTGSMAGFGSRVFYSGAGTLAEPAGLDGIYAFDAQPACDPPAIIDGSLIEAWGRGDNGLATDALGNLFVIGPSSSTPQAARQVRGFSAADIAPGNGSVTGAHLATLADGFSRSLSALSPEGDRPGLAVWQTRSGDKQTPGDIMAVRYTLGQDAAVTGGETITLARAAPYEYFLSLTDDRGRLWLARITHDSPNGPHFFVLGRRPMIE